MDNDTAYMDQMEYNRLKSYGLEGTNLIKLMAIIKKEIGKQANVDQIRELKNSKVPKDDIYNILLGIPKDNDFSYQILVDNLKKIVIPKKPSTDWFDYSGVSPATNIQLEKQYIYFPDTNTLEVVTVKSLEPTSDSITIKQNDGTQQVVSNKTLYEIKYLGGNCKTKKSKKVLKKHRLRKSRLRKSRSRQTRRQY